MAAQSAQLVGKLGVVAGVDDAQRHRERVAAIGGAGDFLGGKGGAEVGDIPAEAAGGGGFGSAVTGGAIGAGTGYLLGQAGGSDVGLSIGGALLGAAIGTVADAYVQDVTYTVITDIRVSERAEDGVVVSQSEQQDLSQGSGGSVIQSSSKISDWKHYQTRVVATANQANVEWEEAAPSMVDGLTRREVDPVTGLLASRWCNDEPSYFELYIPGTEPTEVCDRTNRFRTGRDLPGIGRRR